MSKKMLPVNPVAVILSTHLLTGFGLCLADQVDNYVQRQMRREHIPGLSLAVVKDGRIVKARGYGLADVELNAPAGKDTVYEIGSMTKQFTATAIMILVQDGKLRLEEKITNHLSHLPEAWNEVTVRHLLTHTSGVKGYLSVPNAMAQTVSPISISNIIGMLAPYPLEFNPGEKHVYSNTGYYLLGCIIENVSQRKYADFMKERVFSPLGMNATAVNDLKAVITNRASGYSWRDGRLRRADYMDMSWPFAAGALVSTVEDMAKWDAALYTERLLPDTALEQMWTPVKLSDGSNYFYGFGWYVFDYKGHRLLAHSGGIPGFASCIGRWVDDRVTVIIMLNSDGGRAYLEYLLTQGVARRYIPSLVGKPIEDTVPQVTAKVKAVLVAALADKLDSAMFEDSMRSEFFPRRAKELQSILEDLGPVKSLRLLSKKDVEKSHSYNYRVVFRKEAALLDVTMDEKGSLSAFDFEVE